MRFAIIALSILFASSAWAAEDFGPVPLIEVNPDRAALGRNDRFGSISRAIESANYHFCPRRKSRQLRRCLSVWTTVCGA